MFTIKECTESEVFLPLCERFGAPATELDRVFVFDEDGPKGVGVLGLRHGVVIIKGVYGELDAAYRDVMTRSLLNVCTYMNPIKVRVDEIADYYKIFGFIESDGGMEVMNTAIKFE